MCVCVCFFGGVGHRGLRSAACTPTAVCVACCSEVLLFVLCTVGWSEATAWRVCVVKGSCVWCVCSMVCVQYGVCSLCACVCVVLNRGRVGMEGGNA